MPCSSDYGDQDRAEEEAKSRKQIHCLEASLCAILSVLYTRYNLKEVLAFINEKEAGVTVKQIESWWKIHQARDAARKKAEAAAKEHEEKVKKAKANVRRLSEADRRALREALDE